MAKAKKTPDAVQDASGDTPTTIKIQGLMFPASTRYSEGHALTAQEAQVLNQTLNENLRNNFAAKIRKALEAKAKDQPEDFVAEFTAYELNELQSEFFAYASEYTFSAPRPGRAPMDPVERETRAIAKERVMAALAAKNISSKSLPEGKMEEYIAAVIEKRPEVREEAMRRIAARKEVAADILDL